MPHSTGTVATDLVGTVDVSQSGAGGSNGGLVGGIVGGLVVVGIIVAAVFYSRRGGNNAIVVNPASAGRKGVSNPIYAEGADDDVAVIVVSSKGAEGAGKPKRKRKKKGKKGARGKGADAAKPV